MLLKALYLRNFRSFTESAFQFSPHINAILGQNGKGKSSILEAIHLLSTGRSFRTTALDELIRKGEDHFLVIGELEEGRLSFYYSKKERRIEFGKRKLKALHDLLGIVPQVTYTRYDRALIEGGPLARRRFLNLHLAQEHPTYLAGWIRYHRALQQRNAQLKSQDLANIEVWEEQMKASAMEIQSVRRCMLEELSPLVSQHYRARFDAHKGVHLCYMPSKIDALAKDLEQGVTTIGPHRDEFQILLAGMLSRKFASEGEKESLLLSIKLAELQRLEQQKKSSPIFLIDDVAVHLDQVRRQGLKGLLESKGQIFLTSPEAIFKVDQGQEIIL